MFCDSSIAIGYVYIVTSFIGSGILVLSSVVIIEGETNSSAAQNQSVHDVISNIKMDISGTLQNRNETNITTSSQMTHNVAQTEYIDSHNTVQRWIWILALLGMNMITIVCILFQQGPLWHCLILVGCAVDRWVSILKPLHYESIITAKKITVYIVITFIGSGILVLSSVVIIEGETNSSAALNQSVHDVISNIKMDISGTLQNRNETNITTSSQMTHNVTQTEYIDSQNTVQRWIWILALLGMNMITIGLYSAILVELKKQLRKIQPNINDQAQQRPINMYKGTIKLLFLMIYFTITWGLVGLHAILEITGVFIFLDVLSFYAYMLVYHISGVLVMTPCIVSISIYGLATKQFKNEFKHFIKRK